MDTECENTMKMLIQTVVRMFYEPAHVIITDILLENILLSDAELCSRMKMLGREFNRLIVRLKEDHLVRYDIKVDVQEDNRQVLRTVYFFNYAEVRDIVKYKIFKMTSNLEAKIKISSENFYCPVCDRVFSALDAQGAMEGFIFRCILCKSELVEHVEKSEDNSVSLKQLMSLLGPVISLLKEAEKFKIPSLDYFQMLEIKKEKDKAPGSVPIEEGSPATNLLEISTEKSPEDDEFDEKLETEENTKPEEAEVSVEKVCVNGVLKQLSEITEEDEEAMNEEEYTRYFEICSKYGR